MVTPTPKGFIRDRYRDELFITCPYNASHQVWNPRFFIHLRKCREAYKEKLVKEGRAVTMQICRYNYDHQFLGPELLAHERHCPSQSGSGVYSVPWALTPEGKRQIAAQGGLARPKSDFHVDPAAGDQTDDDAESDSDSDSTMVGAAGPSNARRKRRLSMGKLVKPSSGAEDELDWDCRVQLLDLEGDVDDLDDNLYEYLRSQLNKLNSK